MARKVTLEEIQVISKAYDGALEASKYGEGESEESESRFPCPACSGTYKSLGSLRSHMCRLHPQLRPKDNDGASRLICPRFCGEHIVSYDDLIRHLMENHNFNADTAHFELNTRSELENWLETFSLHNGGMFVRRRGERTHANGRISGEYYCIHDGKKRLTTNGTEDSNGHGDSYGRVNSSHKMGANCPALIKYSILPSGRVRLSGQLAHDGHEMRPMESLPRKRRRLTAEERMAASKQSRQSARIYRVTHEPSPICLDDIDLYEEEVQSRRNSQNVVGFAVNSAELDEAEELLRSIPVSLSLPMNRRVVFEDCDRKYQRNYGYQSDEPRVDLLECSDLVSARLVATAALTRAELALAENRHIRIRDAQRIPQLISKYNQLTLQARCVENLLEELNGIPSRYPSSSAERDETEDEEPGEEEEGRQDEEQVVDESDTSRRPAPTHRARRCLRFPAEPSHVDVHHQSQRAPLPNPPRLLRRRHLAGELRAAAKEELEKEQLAREKEEFDVEGVGDVDVTAMEKTNDDCD